MNCDFLFRKQWIRSYATLAYTIRDLKAPRDDLNDSSFRLKNPKTETIFFNLHELQFITIRGHPQKKRRSSGSPVREEELAAGPANQKRSHWRCELLQKRNTQQKRQLKNEKEKEIFFELSDTPTKDECFFKKKPVFCL